MNKPSSYDSIQASSSFVQVEVGGHVCVIKQVKETQSKNGLPMVVVLFDFDQSDKQHGKFTAEFTANENPEKKWPFDGSKWIMVNDYSDPNKTSKQFKTFCVCAEKSNPGFSIAWGIDDWGKQFVGKKIGAVYGEEEEEYNGERRIRVRMKWFCGAEEAKTAKVPAQKLMKAPAAETAKPALKFNDVTDDIEIPF